MKVPSKRLSAVRHFGKGVALGLLLSAMAAPLALAGPAPAPGPLSPLVGMGLAGAPASTATVVTPVQAAAIGNAIGNNRNGTLAAAGNYTAFPVINASSAPPLVMMVMSRDEQLFVKAYSDYTDLDDDGTIDTTYNDAFDYSGYFDAKLCYQYSDGQFKAAAKVTAADDEKSHQCSGGTYWSGNFLNWISMSRMDVLRLVLYGGHRVTEGPQNTVLQRAYIPNDMHAWAKIYSGSDLNLYTPYAASDVTPGMSFCNASYGTDDTDYPKIAVARGVWPQWASTSLQQCRWSDDNISDDNKKNSPPKSSSPGSSGLLLNVRVSVCDSAPTATFRESFCKLYGTGTSAVYRPVGLLQRYGDDGQMRFGLLTGSFAQPRSGGILRRNIGRLAGNGIKADGSYPGCVAGDEINLANGKFCNQGKKKDVAIDGVINTMEHIRLTGWQGDGWADCNTWSILNRQNAKGGSKHLDNPGQSGSQSYKCSNWGNPVSELYAEALRYIEGDSAGTPGFLGTDLDGLPTATWKDPYGATANPYCSACSILLLSTGLSSFDSDEVPALSAFSDTPVSATKKIGDMEGISNKDWIVGRVIAAQSDLAVGKSVSTYSDLCSPRTVGDLSLVRGLCPDIPSLEGSYLVSGMAFLAHTQDIRPSLTGRPSGQTNTVNTYAVALAENLPKFRIPVGDRFISIVPQCQSSESDTQGVGVHSCHLGDVVIGQTKSLAPKKYIYGRPLSADAKEGSFEIVWEDSTFGSDNDQDATVMITYCVGATCKNNQQSGRQTLGGKAYNGYDICWRAEDAGLCKSSNYKPNVADDEVLIRVEPLATSIGTYIDLGFSITGSDADGSKMPVTVQDFNTILAGSSDNPPASTVWSYPKVLKFKAGSQEAALLQNPLYYAAKYGGFTRTVDPATGALINQPCDSTTTPSCAVSNWDRIDNETGLAGSDGMPDNFFPVRNPAQLGERLAAVFNAILTRAGSGTSAAVVSSSASGDGLTYQALYQARTQNTDGSQIAKWTGSLNALWTDAQGRLREGGYAVSDVPTLGDYSQNPIVVFCTTQEGDSRFLTYTDVDDAPKGVIDPTACTGQTLDKLKTVWSAQSVLSLPTYQTTTQRSYSDAASPANGRYIFTWIDANHDGVVDSDEQKDFVWGESGFNGSGTCTAGSTVTGNFRFLNTCSSAGAQALVNWIRGSDYKGLDGKPDPAWRSRTVDGRIYRLGDIINSTPLSVSTPAEAFDLLYNDSSYGAFRKVYQQRRQMIYVGANDGMLHAFNGGFYDAADKALNEQPMTCDGSDCSLDSSYTAHPLGAELWAYVPGNLLPHLRWLTDPAYDHMFYVDGSPISQDVRIFPKAATDCTGHDTTQCHPDGWGTILIVPFRFGGGPITLDTKSGDTVTQQSSFPAYVVLDVTNPEAKPVLLAELTNTDGTSCDKKVVSCADLSKVVSTYTSSLPALAMFRPSGTSNPDPSKFFLFTGSGTTDNGGVGSVEGGSAVSTTSLGIRAYDLNNVANNGTLNGPAPLTWAGGKSIESFTNVGAVGAGAASFAGDLIASDFNLDGLAESLYFGSTKGGASPYGGSLWAVDFNDSTDPGDWLPRQVLSGLDRPITVRPTLGLNARQQKMVFFGTGRAYAKSDLSDKSRQAIVGLIDSGGTAKFTDLFDETDVEVDTSGNVTGAGEGITDIPSLEAAARTSGGWKYLLEVPLNSANASLPAERVISTQVLSGGALVTTSYLPGTDQCTDQGEGRMYAMNYRTGTGDPGLAGLLGTKTGTTKLNKYVDLGKGLPSQPSLHKGGTGRDGDQQLRVCVQTSSGAIICQDLKPLKGINSGEISWREPIDK